METRAKKACCRKSAEVIVRRKALSAEGLNVEAVQIAVRNVCTVRNEDKRKTGENVTLSAPKVRGRLQINVQTEGGAANGIDGRDFK